uniref:AN1-type domain-containing protein n=1 Tax=Corethrella appendiculata TaxID=1370023 RepID=U5ES23_9DIPT
MEFPELGKHCSAELCNKLDFLPVKCDACLQNFCSDHFSYQKHMCSTAHQKDVQVPICPLCSEPVPTPRDVSADLTVGRHIDQFCRSEKKKIYTNRCSFKNCKTKELIPVNCGVCKLNFCLKHRHTLDHQCAGEKVAQRNRLLNAATQRQNNNSNHVQQIQGSMSEDEALALALSLSEQEDNNNRRQSNLQNRITVGGGSSLSKDKCNLS